MTAELVGACPNTRSGQCSTCSALAAKLAERDAELAKSESERDQAMAERDLAMAKRDQAVAKLAERDTEKLSLERRVDELERSASRNSFNNGKPPSSDGLAKPPADQIRTRS